MTQATIEPTPVPTCRPGDILTWTERQVFECRPLCPEGNCISAPERSAHDDGVGVFFLLFAVVAWQLLRRRRGRP